MVLVFIWVDGNLHLECAAIVSTHQLHDLVLLHIVPQPISACHNQVARLYWKLVQPSIIRGVSGIGVVWIGSELQGAIEEVLQCRRPERRPAVPDQ